MNRIGLYVITSLLCSASALSAAPVDYRTALERIERDEVPFETLEHWRDQLLYPHLVAHWVDHNLEAVDPDWLTPLLTQADFTAAFWFTREAWLAELARREDWQRYLDTARLLEREPAPCLNLVARDTLGLPITRDALREVWLTGQSLPDACDPFLSRLREEPDYDDLVWQRQLLAFKARSASLVRYLNTRYRSEEYRARGQRLSDVYRHPADLLKDAYRPDDDWQRDLALAAMDRMAYRDPQGASNLWVRLIQATPAFGLDDIRPVSAHLGVAMAKLGLPAADYWLTLADPGQTDRTLQHWRLQIALARGDWAAVVRLHRGLSDPLRTQGQWRYWYAVALGQTGDTDRADRLMDALAGERSYYGFLAADALNRPIALAPDTLPAPSPEASRRLLDRPGFQRARALFEAGDLRHAQVEWNLTGRSLDRTQWLNAARLAQQWRWYHKASQAAAWSGHYGALDLRYPTPWLHEVSTLERELGIPRYWIYGVMRQESHYMTDAESSVGALGLMQVLPATARHIARNDDLDYGDDWDLTEPGLNLELGSRYLSRMTHRFGDPVYATAAYNAGPSRVERWLARNPVDRRIWIESIPFDETRHYVKSVLAYTQVYAARDASDWRLARWLAPNQVATGDRD